VGFVWAVRRSLRLLTLLTLMASALCSGQTLAAQEITSPRATIADGVADSQPHALVATHIFEGESAVTLASATIPTGAPFALALSSTAALPAAPAAPVPPVAHFSPLAERAPPAAV
jgi:hypothetical protein